MKKICKNPNCVNELINKRSDPLYCDNKCRLRYQKRRWFLSNIEEVNRKSKEWYKNNKERVLLDLRKSYIKSTKPELTEEEKNLKMENRKEYDRLRALKYYYNNKEVQNRKKVIRDKLKMETNPLFKLSHNIRTLIRISMRNQFTTKSKRTIEILGCSFEEFYKHLESKFDDKMNWGNQGTYWHRSYNTNIFC